jgi:hypothetical protein
MSIHRLILLSFCLMVLGGLAVANPVIAPLVVQMHYESPYRYLVYWNLLIGILEGLLLMWSFKGKTHLSIPIMIVANLFSALVTFFALLLFNMPSGLYVEGIRSLMMYHENAFWQIFFFMYLLALMLEWPFCLYALKKSRDPWFESVKAVVLTQSASYGCLAFYFYIWPPMVH